jgi:LuxR family transcriptional regulator, quorum-sensing system regulator BjaR1
MTQIRQTAFEILDTLQQAASLDEILKELSSAGNEFGFENFSISGLPLPKEKIDPYVMLCGWPSEWAQRYMTNSYVDSDPVIAKVRSSSMPFAWEEAVKESKSKQGLIVMDEAKDFGLCEGFSVPIYTTHGFQAIVTFGAERMSLSSEEKAALHLVAIYAHSRVRSFLPASYDTLDRNIPSLTNREIECLKWSAAGKTAWEISVILSISARTVEQFLISSAHKMKATNRTQTVAEALRRNFIQ